MAGTIILSNKENTVIVELTNLDCEVKYRFSNPFFTFSTPQEDGELIGTNTYCVNIGLVSSNFDLTFKLRDGPGVYDKDAASPTNFEKILLLSHTKNPKHLSLYGTVYTGQIESFDVSWQPAKKDYAEGCMLSFKLTADIDME